MTRALLPYLAHVITIRINLITQLLSGWPLCLNEHQTNLIFSYAEYMHLYSLHN